jgi:hypothetical protein
MVFHNRNFTRSQAEQGEHCREARGDAGAENNCPRPESMLPGGGVARSHRRAVMFERLLPPPVNPPSAVHRKLGYPPRAS